jgi:hypothetical protein
MWGGRDSGAMAMASRALEKATEAATGNAVLTAQIGAHLAECTKANADKAARDADFRRQTEQWREGLGVRLDRQDKQLTRAVISGLSALVTVLATAAGFLVVHFVLK